MVKEFIDSDRVNYLVWRYLLECNYRETAAKFQKEWHVQKPHRDFSFARHVKCHALVSVINRGLSYQSIERDYALRKLPEGAPAEKIEAVQMGIFGPLSGNQQPAKVEEVDEDAEGDEVIELEEPSRKRVPDQQQPNGSPAKRPRLSNGIETGSTGPDATAASATTATATATATTPMDLDQHTDNHAYPSPYEGEQAPEPMTRTDGPEQGTQVDKVEELAPVTTFLSLTGDEHAQPSVSAPASETAPLSPSANSENAPILLQCEWNPRDPSVLAAAGTDALARVWTLSRPPLEPGQDHVPNTAHSLVEPGALRDTTVTALAWTSDGVAIAVAADSKERATISLWTADGGHIQTMDVSDPPIVKLAWNPSNSAILAVSPGNGGALVTVYYTPSGDTITHFIPGYDIAATPLDATWTSDVDFLLCGGEVLLSLTCGESSIEQIRKFETKEDDSFSQVLYDPRSRLAATSSDRGTLHLWDESGQRRSISAHQGAITTMQWQPLLSNQTCPDDERLIATGGDDCAILVWNARMPESKPKCFLTMDSPIVRLAFTPDGAFIAGATSSQILIWKVGSHAVPRASWSRPPHPGWLTPKGSSESDEEDEHCLCWDADGQKLAYGSNSRLAVISFSR